MVTVDDSILTRRAQVLKGIIAEVEVEGEVIAYSTDPMVCVRDDDGKHHWVVASRVQLLGMVEKDGWSCPGNGWSPCDHIFKMHAEDGCQGTSSYVDGYSVYFNPCGCSMTRQRLDALPGKRGDEC